MYLYIFYLVIFPMTYPKYEEKVEGCKAPTQTLRQLKSPSHSFPSATVKAGDTKMGAAMGTPSAAPEVSEADLEFICKNTDMTEDQARDGFASFMENNPEGKMTRESFREMMKLCYSGADSRNLEKHIFRKNCRSFQ